MEQHPIQSYLDHVTSGSTHSRVDAWKASALEQLENCFIMTQAIKNKFIETLHGYIDSLEKTPSTPNVKEDTDLSIEELRNVIQRIIHTPVQVTVEQELGAFNQPEQLVA